MTTESDRGVPATAANVEAAVDITGEEAKVVSVVWPGLDTTDAFEGESVRLSPQV